MESFELWRFSLWVYHQKDVAPTCLRLQERYGIDVNILLFALWLGHCGHAIDGKTLRALSAEASEWHASIVLPLRRIRKCLKFAGYLGVREAVSDYRERIKIDEIDAEQLEQKLLFEAAERKFGPNLKATMDADLREELAGANAASCFDLLNTVPSKDDRKAIRKLSRVAPMFALGPHRSVR